MVGHGECGSGSYWNLASETIQGTALAFESIHHVHGRYRFALGMLRVGYRVSDDILEEHLEYPSGLLVD